MYIYIYVFVYYVYIIYYLIFWKVDIQVSCAFFVRRTSSGPSQGYRSGSSSFLGRVAQGATGTTEGAWGWIKAYGSYTFFWVNKGGTSW